METPRVLTYDPSTHLIGWSVIEPAGVVAADTIRPEHRNLPAPERALSLAWQFAELIPRYRPTHIYGERPVTMKGNSNGDLRMVQGQIWFAVWAQSARTMKPVEMAWSTWRRIVGFKFATIEGERDSDREKRLKTALTSFAARTFPDATFSTADCCEAALIGKAALEHIAGRAKLPAEMEEEIEQRRKAKAKKAARAAATPPAPKLARDELPGQRKLAGIGASR